MLYKETIQEIRDLPWSHYHPFSITVLSLASAKEFAESLRSALRAHPKNANLRKMAAGELDTNNLQYGGYVGEDKRGDHYQFLEYFVNRFGVHAKFMKERSEVAVNDYLETVNSMDSQQRAMTVFSREQELPNIFEEILKAHNWQAYGLGFYEYYLQKHIELDSEEGGHGDLTNGFPLDENVLDRFYTARLTMYKGGLVRMDNKH